MTGKPGDLQSMGLERVRHELMTEQQSVCAYVLSHFSHVLRPTFCDNPVAYSQPGSSIHGDSSGKNAGMC